MARLFPFAVLAAVWLPLGVGAAETKNLLPPPAAHRVDFAREIEPIFEASCIKCHARGRDQGGFSIETRAHLLEGGDTGAAAEVGKSDTSYLIELVAGADPDLVMPQKGSRLTPRQVGLLRAWIDQGMTWESSITFALPPPHNLTPRLPAIPGGASAGNPIDRFLAPYFAAHGVTPSALIGERLYARRVYLAVIGLLPPPDELAAFIADRDPEKRTKLVRRLLADSPNYAQNWMSFWNDLLRNSYKGAGNRQQITAWLYRALAENLPYDRFVGELIDPTPATAGFVAGIVWRGTINASETPQMQAAQNISQVFLGVNLKCASCHDSFVNDLTLADAYGMAGIYAGAPLEMVRCDKPTGKKAVLKFLYPQLGSIDASADSPSRLRQFAAIMTEHSNGRLTRTVVNRYWERLMGHGLVGDVDDMEQVSWDPDLLDWLAEDFAAHGHDLRHLLEQILTSQAFQLPAVATDEKASAAYVFRGPRVGRMTAEQFGDAICQLTGVWYALPDAKVDFSAGVPPTLRAPVPSVRRIAAAETTAAPNATAVLFRREVTVGRPAEFPFVIVSAKPAYALQVNGGSIGKRRTSSLGEFDVIDLRGLIKTGSNRFAVRISSGAEKGSAAGWILSGRLETAPPAPAEAEPFQTDSNWVSAAALGTDWPALDPPAVQWSSAIEVSGAATPANSSPPGFALAFATATQFGRIRSSLVEATKLQLALGRPARDVVTTIRSSAATTLQALEFSNGQELSDRLHRGAENLLAACGHDPRTLVRQVYLRALGRQPRGGEMDLACASLGQPVRLENLEDLLWVESMQPEFQLIY